MATNKIKGLTVEIGGDTTKLGKALEDVNKKTRSLSGELRQIDRLLKLDPGNTELLAQKQDVLAEAIEQTREKLDKLKEAERQVQAQFQRGEVSSEQVRELRREILSTTDQLAKYEKAAAETADALEGLGKESDTAADDVTKVADAEQRASSEGKGLGDSLKSKVSTGLKAVTVAATAAVGALVGVAESSREYRTEMGKLDTAFQNAGHSSEAAKQTYEELQSILGETDQAVEAANHLAKLCDNEAELIEWTDIATGVFAVFGDSLPVENLTEAANETAKTGQVVGGLADAINWAAKEGETFGVTLKANTKENEAWNKAVEDATTAEDYFNLALQDCSSEQERQALITETLTELYSDAADTYRDTNKEVIEANKASEKWNAALAKLGKRFDPIVSDAKEMGAAFLEDIGEPLEDIAGFIISDVLPALGSFARWVTQNIPLITAGIGGLTAAMTAHKVSVYSAKLAVDGYTVATKAAAVAQKAFALAQSLTPWALVGVAIGGVVGTLAVLTVELNKATENTDGLTDEQKELADASHEAADALRDQQAASDESAAGVLSQMGYISDLADELGRMADANGRVQESDQARAQFILGELNAALGTEYQMNDGIIQQYGTLKANIDEVIAKKKAEALLEVYKEDWALAVKNEAAAYDTLINRKRAYEQQLPIFLAAKAEADAAEQASNEAKAANYEGMTQREINALNERVWSSIDNLAREKAILDERGAAYDQAAEDFGANQAKIQSYEDATTKCFEGNYSEVENILTGKRVAMDQYADGVGAASKEAVAALFQEAVDAGLAAKTMKEKFEEGVDGYTQEMVDEAEQAYKDTFAEFDTAYKDAYGVASDMGAGLGAGLDSQRSWLMRKAGNLIDDMIARMRASADSNSPSKETMGLGEDMGEGTGIGLEKKTKFLMEIAQDQVDGLLDVYSGQKNLAGQAVFRGLQAASSRRQEQSYQTMANSTSSKLDQILVAIEKGQVIYLDGDKLVGGTTSRMDASLGRQRILVERGAI